MNEGNVKSRLLGSEHVHRRDVLIRLGRLWIGGRRIDGRAVQDLERVHLEIDESTHPPDRVETLCLECVDHRSALAAFLRGRQRSHALHVGQRLDEPADLGHGRAGVLAASGHHLAKGRHVAQRVAAGALARLAIEDFLGQGQIVGGAQQGVPFQQEVDDLGGRPIGGGRLLEQQERRPLDRIGRFRCAPLGQIGGNLVEQFPGLAQVALHVGQHRHGRLVLGRLDHGDVELAGRHAPQIVEVQPKPLAEPGKTLLKLPTHVLGERFHRRSVHQLTQLGLVPLLVENLDVRDLEHALGRLGQEPLAETRLLGPDRGMNQCHNPKTKHYARKKSGHRKTPSYDERRRELQARAPDGRRRPSDLHTPNGWQFAQNGPATQFSRSRALTLDRSREKRAVGSRRQAVKGTVFRQ